MGQHMLVVQRNSETGRGHGRGMPCRDRWETPAVLVVPQRVLLRPGMPAGALAFPQAWLSTDKLEYCGAAGGCDRGRL